MNKNVTTRCGSNRIGQSLCLLLLVVFVISTIPAEAEFPSIPKDTVSNASPVWAWKSIATGIPSARQDHTAVWTGSEMIVWGGHDDDNYNYDHTLNDGARYSPTSSSWKLLPTINSPLARDGHTAIWTGSEMIIWGGWDGYGTDTLNDGGRYNPTTDSWMPLLIVGAPSARYDHTAIWTGSEMIVWGGWDGTDVLGDGARYNPITDSWTPLTTVGAPSARYDHTAVWTGSEMIVWGGWNGTDVLGDGARYNPNTDSWISLTAEDAPSVRYDHTAVWTGSEMIVWGGWDGTDVLGDGARYNPITDSWTPLPTANAPVGRAVHTAVWTGSEMIVWGGWYYNCFGFGCFADSLDNGARYDPSADQWTYLSTNSTLSPRDYHTAVWSGSRMIVWGGARRDMTVRNDGADYDPASNSWTHLSSNGVPSARLYHTAVWTGSDMIIWGGYDAWFSFHDGSRYNLATNKWISLPAANAPSASQGHTATWTGSEMIIWGGTEYASGGLNEGARYRPLTDEWTAVTTTDAPTARYSHTAVWTGSEMIVWGGYSGWLDRSLNDGARYRPATDEWTPVTTTDAPSGRWGTHSGLDGFGNDHLGRRW